jgi:hypothetical protein
MAHVVLLGDSIFDNASYVPGRPDVPEQLRRALPRDCRVTLLARDGALASDVPGQAERISGEATHLFISVGGNDALQNAWLINESGGSIGQAFTQLAQIQQKFRRDYQDAVRAVLARRKPTTLCTIYDAVPGLEREELTALSVWNDAIVREAIRWGLPVLDLRMICTDPTDYSNLSPIEPSERGGAKIVAGIVRVLAGHDFTRPLATIYGAPPGE